MDQNYFLGKINHLLSNKNLMRIKNFDFKRKAHEIDDLIYYDFWSAFRKILIFGCLKNCINAAKNSYQKYYEQIELTRKLIYNCLES